LAELQQAIQTWNDLIQQAIAQQNSGTARVRRDDGTDILTQIANARAAIISLQARWRQLTATITRHFKTGDNYKLLEDIEMQDLSQLHPPVDEQLVAIASDAAIVANVGLNAAAIIAQKAITTLGKPRVIKGGIVVVVATGIFKIGFSLLDSLIGDGNTPQPSQSLPPTMPPTSTPSPTKTSASRTSSSTCTYTEGPTPVIVVTKKGTTRSQFQELVSSLPVDKESETLTDSWLPNWAYIGEMDRCTAEKLWDNPIVEAMTLNRPIVIFESNDVDPSTIDPNAPLAKRVVVSRTDYNNTAAPQRRRSPEWEATLSERTLASDKRYVYQSGSGTHIRWIAGQSRQRRNLGQFYDFEEYLYDDRSLKPSDVFPPRIYVVDTAFLTTHQDISSRVRSVIAVSGDAGDVDSSHGTCMTSIAAGDWTGVYKDADIVLVQARFNQGQPAASVDTVIKAFGAIMRDVQELGLGGQAVISMSFGEAIFLQASVAPTPTLPISEKATNP
jgi:hypothetical protein